MLSGLDERSLFLQICVYIIYIYKSDGFLLILSILGHLGLSHMSFLCMYCGTKIIIKYTQSTGLEVIHVY